MTESAALTRPVSGLLPTQSDWSTMMQMADAFVKSGLLPDAIKTPQAALLIIQKGRELGIQPTYALSNIAVIKGKPAASAELMLALIYRDHGDNAMRFRNSTAEECMVLYKRRSWDKAESYSFTIQDARTANLTNNPTWKTYPAAMLRARCISAVARMAFPDSIGGMYTPEELGAHEAVSGDGQVELIEADWKPQPAIEQYGDQNGAENRPGQPPEHSVAVAEIADQLASRHSQLTDGDPRAADPAPESSPSGSATATYKAASANQLATISKLTRLLGLPEDYGDVTVVEASEKITELSREYNARKGVAGARR